MKNIESAPELTLTPSGLDPSEWKDRKFRQVDTKTWVPEGVNECDEL